MASPSLSREQRNEVLAWCNKWGLLGLLPQFARHVVLAPRWEPLLSYREVQDPDGGTYIVAEANVTGRLAVTQRRYARDGALWRERKPQSMPPLRRTRSTKPRSGPGMLALELPRGWPAPCAVFDSTPALHSNEPDAARPLGREWARFFPGIAGARLETFPYPRPFTDAFWRQYGEPLHDFLLHARLLAMLLENLAPPRARRPGPREAPVWVARARSRDALHQLVASVAPVLDEQPDGTFLRRRQGPSLLAALAAMMFDDVADRHRAYRCARCGEAATAPAWQARYCSPRCRKTAEQARRRNRLRERFAEAVRGRSRVRQEDATRVACRLERKFGSAAGVRCALEGSERDVVRALVAHTLPGLGLRDVERVLSRLVHA